MTRSVERCNIRSHSAQSCSTSLAQLFQTLLKLHSALTLTFSCIPQPADFLRQFATALLHALQQSFQICGFALSCLNSTCCAFRRHGLAVPTSGRRLRSQVSKLQSKFGCLLLQCRHALIQVSLCQALHGMTVKRPLVSAGLSDSGNQIAELTPQPCKLRSRCAPGSFDRSLQGRHLPSQVLSDLSLMPVHGCTDIIDSFTRHHRSQLQSEALDS
mmetsp:Transcript_87487/g.164900  ORF Transcript_87487/g.164900 Transcript_87487/m.164900 type:complete len:215 (+) Transcript_87487:205-849(+)